MRLLARPFGTGEVVGVAASPVPRRRPRALEAHPGRRPADDDAAPGRRRQLGLLAAVLVVLLVLAMVVGHVANRHTPIDTWWFGSLGLTVCLGLTGALVSRRMPMNPIGWIFLVGAIGQGITGASREWTVYAVATAPGSLPGPAWAAWVGSWTSSVGFATLPLVLLLFPDGRLRSARWRPVLVLVVAACVLASLGAALMPGPFTPSLPALVNPVGLDLGRLSFLTAVPFAVLQAAAVPAAVSLVLRWRRATADQQAQLRWVSVAGAVLVVETVLESSPLGDLRIFQWLAPSAVAAFVACIGVAVLRHHLWDLDLLVNVSLVVAVLTLLLGGLFVVVVAVVATMHDGSSLLWPTVVTAGVVGIGFVPLRRRVQAGVDRLVYGRAPDPHRALAGLTHRLNEPNSPEGVLRPAVEAVAAAFLRLDYVAVHLPDDGPTVATGRLRAPSIVLPLAFQGAAVGELEVAARPGARPPSATDEAFTGVVPQMAAVAHGVLMTQAVVTARRALVTAREEERRRLRRDLHDGLGPALAAASMRAESAAFLAHSDPEQACGVMFGLAEELRGTIEDVRRLVYDLQPPVLDAVGLAAAVREQAVAFSTDGGPGRSSLRVDVAVPDSLGDLPAAVEIAAYRIACEALANVARHAGAGRCVVTLGLDAHELRVEVDDDGVGLEAGSPLPRVGVGTVSMVERATELGGSCRTLPSELGGMRVEARLPIGPLTDRPRPGVRS